jgi:MATE family multidrug resistance protein
MADKDTTGEPTAVTAPPDASVSPLRELLTLAAPTIAQMASYTVMQFADTKMLATYSHEIGSRSAEPTAAANAGLLSFAILSLGWGTVQIVNALVSQNFGQRDYASCGRYLWQGVWFAVAYGLLVLPVALFATSIFTAFGHEPHLVPLQAEYMRITLAWGVLVLARGAFNSFLLAIGRPNFVLVGAVAAVVANVFFNWLLIWGHWGFPRLGLAGAAWGTNAAVTVELLLLVLFSLRGSIRRTYNALDWRPRWAEMRLVLKVGVPSGVQVVADVLAWSLFGVLVMAQLGTAAMAAHNFMMRYMVVSFMPAFGVSTAVTALVGRYIGMGRHDLAEQRAHLGFAVCAVYMVLCGAVFFVARHWLIGQFADDPAILAAGATLMIFAAFYQLFDAVYIVYVGALRGAGDTAVPAAITTTLCWTITVGGGLLIAKTQPQLGPSGPWFAAMAYGVILGAFIFARFARGRWKSIRLETDSKGPTMA